MQFRSFNVSVVIVFAMFFAATQADAQTPPWKPDRNVEILTGTAAGQSDGDGKFEAGTVFALIDERLRHMARTLKEFEC